jgi:hypothetical protein
VNRAAANYIRDFAWDASDEQHAGLEPYFNLDGVEKR